MADQSSAHRRRVVAAGIDASRVYNDEEDRRLLANLHALTISAYGRRFDDEPLTADTLLFLHARLFEGVRDHAGKMRGPDRGSEILTFGPNRSVDRIEVPSRIDAVFQRLARALQSFLANPNATGYDEAALQLVAWAQAEIIRVHPFEDGNGRTTRLFCDLLLMRLGLRPILIETVKEEYNLCLNEYFRSGDLRPLADLLIRLYILE